MSRLSPVAIHQFVPVLATRDAVGTHTLMVQDLLREIGFESKIFVAEADAELGKRAHPFRSYHARQGSAGRTWLIYQCATGNLIADFLLRQPEPKLLNYHNLTPPELLESWDPAAVHAVRVGQHQVARLAPQIRLAIAMSHFSEHELMAAGYRATAVVPPLWDLSAFEQDPDHELLGRLRDRRDHGGVDLLFVGRISPSKAQHDLVKALAAYRRVYDPDARLHLVGRVSSPAYGEALGQLVKDLDLDEAVNFAGSVTQAELIAYYQATDLFVSCSDHEGFCLPLVEAMYHRLPVLAYDAGAVGETLGPAGVVLPEKGATLVAAAAHRLIEDANLRQTLTAAGDARLQEITPARNRARLAAVIEEAVAGSIPAEDTTDERAPGPAIRPRTNRQVQEPAHLDRF